MRRVNVSVIDLNGLPFMRRDIVASQVVRKVLRPLELQYARFGDCIFVLETDLDALRDGRAWVDAD